MSKFGSSTGIPEDKDTLEKRKQKFGNTAMLDEDEETRNKRKERFGVFQSDKQLQKEKIEERKKKFGDPEQDIDLDEEIKKSKGIKKHGKPLNPPHFKRRFNDSNKKFFRR